MVINFLIPNSLKFKKMALPFHSNGVIAVFKMPKTVYSQVVFGTPSRNCSGSGICKVYTIHGAKRLNISCEMVSAKLTNLGTHLKLSFSKTACSSQLIQQQFAQGNFTVEEDYVLPSWLTRKLNVPFTCISKGTYPVQVQGDYVGIKLPFTPAI